MQEQLKMRAEKSKHARGGQEAKTYLVCSKSKRKKCPEQWKHISNNGNDEYALQNIAIESLAAQNRKIAFGRLVELLGNLEDIAASVKSKMAGGRGGKRTADVDGTNSGGDVDSNRAEAARLAAESQHTHNNAKR